ncbi:ubiquinol oxidase subunit II [Lichenihabitans psoromatis]|uniref:ubiquinol oxidase subunit II n=1 Tax=Lichenihabitans psoromatis TaxID=2528642 RepID=UPI0010383F99|nr:ubiquinol oxidase subunit II [Lichenihabitans psoromatis]
MAKIDDSLSSAAGRRALRRIRRFAPPAVAIAGAALLSGCSLRLLDPAGPVGASERTLLLNALAVMLCIVIPTIVATLAFAWWFRAGNTKAEHLPTWAFSGRVEIVTWSVPLLTIMFLGGIAWIGSHELDPAVPLAGSKKPIEIQVVSLDWKWLFIYPDEKVASLNQLVIPAGTPVHFSLTSSGVWNSFFVPQLGSMIYTMSGMTTQLNLQADREGTYYGMSSHLSGEGFADMHFDVKALSDDGYAAWLQQAQSASATLDGEAYNALAKQSTNNPSMTYRVADADLFQKIVSLRLPPGPGPAPQTASGSDPHPGLTLELGPTPAPGLAQGAPICVGSPKGGS